MISERSIYTFWTKEDEQLLRHTFLSLSEERLTQLFPKRNWRAIKDKAFKLGLQKHYSLKHPPFTDSEKLLLHKLWPASSIINIRAAFPNRSFSFLNNKANEFGIHCVVERNRLGTIKRLLEDSNVAYYWAGFIAADGYINHETGQLVVMLSSKDRDHLQKLADFIETNVKDYYTSAEQHFPMVRVSVQEPTAVKSFIDKFDFNPRKTYNPPESLTLSGNKFLAYWAGFIDGDGSIVLARPRNDGHRNAALRVECHVSWANVLDNFVTKLHAMFEIECKTKAHIYKKNNGREYVNISIANSNLLLQLKESLYELDLPLMERKWSRISGREKC